MSTSTCPNGHVTASPDYCDTCGAPMDQSPAPDAGKPSRSSSAAAPSGTDSGGTAAGGGTAATQPCPNCAMANAADALFCEACGYDFTTGTMPRPTAPTNALDLDAPPAGAPVQESVAPAVAVEWVAEIWVDPDWYADQDSDEPCPSAGLPVVVPLRTQSLLIGRRSKSRNIHPEIECASDVGVSRRPNIFQPHGVQPVEHRGRSLRIPPVLRQRAKMGGFSGVYCRCYACVCHILSLSGRPIVI